MDNLLLLYSGDNSLADYYSFLYDSFLKFLLQNINNKTIFCKVAFPYYSLLKLYRTPLSTISLLTIPSLSTPFPLCNL
jgi:hypothetical protein